MEIDNRKLRILAEVVDEYIKTGEPVGSNTVLANLDIGVSSATVRNDMASLEALGLLEHPHTSAGRVPTFRAYRLYIESLMQSKPLTSKEKALIDSMLIRKELAAEAVVDNAVTVLSNLTELAVISKTNILDFSVITRVEVIPAGRRLYALLIITSAGVVKNKICRIEFDLTNEQLGFFGKFINENLQGIHIDKMTPAMLQSLSCALGGYMLTLSPLLRTLYELSEEVSNSEVNLKGEQKLITSGINANEAVSLIARKNDLQKLLSNAFDGISVIFGKENEAFAVTNSSMIVSPYKINGEQGGSLGVIGPVRLDYAKIIPHIQYISQSMTKILSDCIENEKNDEIVIRKEEDRG